MTTVNIDLRAPDMVSPATGQVVFIPTRRLNAGDFIILPAPLPVRLVDGKATVDLLATEPTWAWQVIEKTTGGKSHFVAVPNSLTPIEYGDLVDVDPATLEPLAEPEAAWWVALNDLILGGGGDSGAALVTHINSPTPHPQYDDLPSLRVLFENGLI